MIQAQPNHPSTNSGTNSHAVVIGGGLAGIAAAAELSTNGVLVTVIEQNTHLGGKMNLLEESGFTFDMGPTIITMPQVLRGIIERSGANPAELLTLIDLDPQWRCLFEDGTGIDLRRGLDTMIADLDQQFPGQSVGEGYRKFVDWSRRMFGLSEKVFFYKDLGGVEDLMRKPPKDPGLLSDVVAMRMHSSMAGTVHRFIQEPHVRQMCEHFLQYVGSSPFLSPAILGLIASAQVDQGCWYAMPPEGAEPGAKGGTRLVARAVQTVCERNGVEFVLGARVVGIDSEGDRVTGVTLDDGRTIKADLVVSNCDIQRTYRDIRHSAPIAERALREQKAVRAKYEPACSGLVLYMGLNKRYEHLAHHNFLFSGDSHAEFDDIYHKGIPARDPTVYLAAPSMTDPTQAPMFDGQPGEALYALIHTPYRREHQRWEEQQPDGSAGLLEQYRPVVIEKLKRFGMEDIEDRIVVERHLTPDSIERLYNAEGGAIYGLASHGKLKGGFKPKNRSRVFKNMYLAGGSANPGPGMPMVLMSGVTAARAACEDIGLDPIGHPNARLPEGLTAGVRPGEASMQPIGA